MDGAAPVEDEVAVAAEEVRRREVWPGGELEAMASYQQRVPRQEDQPLALKGRSQKLCWIDERALARDVTVRPEDEHSPVPLGADDLSGRDGEQIHPVPTRQAQAAALGDAGRNVAGA